MSDNSSTAVMEVAGYEPSRLISRIMRRHPRSGSRVCACVCVDAPLLVAW